MEVGNAPRATAAQHLLAGLETGVVAALAMLAWLGFSALWYRHSFWTAPNLLASTFYGEFALRNNFNGHTLPGLALYVLIYGSLGMLFGMAIQGRSASLRITCIGILGAVAWYYFLFGLVWKTWNPLLVLYTQDRPMFAGHVLFGMMLGRYPRNLKGLLPKAEQVPIETDAPLTAPDQRR